jgi:hypothetical protein
MMPSPEVLRTCQRRSWTFIMTAWSPMTSDNATTLMLRQILWRDGTFVPLPEPDARVLEERRQRTVLAEFLRQGWLEKAAAAAMLAWSHSGFGAHVGTRIEEREGLLRVALLGVGASGRVAAALRRGTRRGGAGGVSAGRVVGGARVGVAGA